MNSNKKRIDANELYFYECEICGNLIVKLHDSGMTPYCCSRPMTRLMPGRTEGAKEKHIPVSTYLPSEDPCTWDVLHVEVGSVLHPMSEDHLIRWIVVLTDSQIRCRFFKAGDLPKADFIIHKEEEVLRVYAYCNMHGLWEEVVNRP